MQEPFYRDGSCACTLSASIVLGQLLEPVFDRLKPGESLSGLPDDLIGLLLYALALFDQLLGFMIMCGHKALQHRSLTLSTETNASRVLRSRRHVCN